MANLLLSWLPNTACVLLDQHPVVMSCVSSKLCCGAANMAKVPHGGWFALAIAGAVFAFSFVWWWGSNTKNNTLIATQVSAWNFCSAVCMCISHHMCSLCGVCETGQRVWP